MLRKNTASSSEADSTADGAGAAARPPTAQEGGNRPNVPLQEKSYRGVLWGLRNVPDTP